jgi:hypothetical protein
MSLTMPEKIETNYSNLKFNYYCENIHNKRKKITLDGIVYLFREIVPNIKSCVLYFSKFTTGLITFELKYPELSAFYELLINEINFSEIEEAVGVYTDKYVKEVERKMLNTLVRKSHALMAYFKSQVDDFKLRNFNNKDYFEYQGEKYTILALKRHLKKIISEDLITKISDEMNAVDSKFFQDTIHKVKLKLDTPDINNTVYQMQLLRDLAGIDDLETVDKGSDLSILINKILTTDVGLNLRKQIGADFYDQELNRLQMHYLTNT